MRPGDVVDRYVVEQFIGAGSVGVVFRARHQALGTLHALKIVTPTGPAQRQRFVREARIQALLRHPNVVRVTDVVELDHQLVLVAELVEGQTLADLLLAGAPPLDLALDLFRQVLAGVEAAHAQRIVHRDLKPENVLLTQDEGRPLARVSDFGIARAADPAIDSVLMTRTGAAMGTPAYMAPEQRTDASTVDQRADIYSLGCILYELCVGQRPFTATTLTRLAQDAEAERYPRPTQAVAGFDPTLEALIVDCLRADPDLRPATCGAVRERLDAVAQPARSPPPAPPLPPVRAQSTLAPVELRTLPPARDRRVLLAGGVGLALLAGLAAGRAGWQAGAEQRAPRSESVAVVELAPAPAEAAAGEPVAEAAGAMVAEVRGEAAGEAAGEAVSTEAAPKAVRPAVPAAAEVQDAAEGGRGQAREQRPAPAAQASASPPAVEAQASGTRWRIVGEGVQARLVGEGGAFAPGPVPAGVFLVRARFGDQPELDAGYVSVRDGEETRVACDEAFQQCRRLP